jgi:ubiquinone/menaquinone biosynthesis C-methylase UbiE
MEVETIDVHAAFEGATAPENRFILSHIGDVRGKQLLDLGCGAGENSVYFARKGACCTAADYSAGMVKTALKLAKNYDVHISGHIVDAAAIDFPDDSFDIVYAANVLHHVDALACTKEIHRVLKPGGVACVWDPLRHNPLINVYRRMARSVRTRDENPLEITIVKVFRSLFSKVEYDTFWLATLWIFIRFYLIERVNPNQERYWKKIISEEKRLRPLYRRLEKIDHQLKKISYLKRFAWNIALVAQK